jgi:catechol 2,3-dioxygenase-like lactoylglutathione lyase family enzyme
MPRGIDHIVIAVHDLDTARATWQRLGFALTPVARHTFGTANSLIQLDGNYVELLAVADPNAIAEAAAGGFSFAAFNRDFLKKREGLSMLALKSLDAAADQADFEARGLPVFAPFAFERLAKGPDGEERKVAFSLTFTREPRLREAGFFTCQHHFPENFWRPEYRSHVNSARGIESVVLVTRDPADFHEFLTQITGKHDMTSTSLGVTFDTGEGIFEIMSPIGYRAWFGESPEPDPRRFLACRIAVADLSATRRLFDRSHIAFSERMGALIVPAGATNGVAVAFVQDVSGDKPSGRSP